jgi:hypothetical protein
VPGNETADSPMTKTNALRYTLLFCFSVYFIFANYTFFDSYIQDMEPRP